MRPTETRIVPWVALFVAAPLFASAQPAPDVAPVDAASEPAPTPESPQTDASGDAPEDAPDVSATAAANSEAVATPTSVEAEVVPEPESPVSSALATLAEYVAIHGFGNYGAGWTRVREHNTNDYQFGDHNGDFGFVNFSLRQLVQPIPELRFSAGQSFSVQGGDVVVELDLAGAQWTPNRTFSLRLGRILSPLGIYTEVYRVGTLRPFGMLPTSIYANAGFINQSYDGGEIAVSFETDGGWRGRVAAIGGRAIIPQDGAVSRVVEAALMYPMNTLNSRVVMDLMMGAHFSLETPVEGLSFAYGIAGSLPKYTDLIGDETIAQNWNNVVMIGSASLLRERFEIRSEIAYRFNLDRDATGTTARMLQKTLGFYVEGAYRIIDQVQVGLRYERMHQHIDDATSELIYQRQDAMGNVIGSYDSIEFSNDLGAVVSYWWNRDFVLKAEYHFIDGNRFAHPNAAALYDLVANDRPLARRTHFLGFSSAFSF